MYTIAGRILRSGVYTIAGRILRSGVYTIAGRILRSGVYTIASRILRSGVYTIAGRFAEAEFENTHFQKLPALRGFSRPGNRAFDFRDLSEQSGFD